MTLFIMEKLIGSKFGNFAENKITNLQNFKGGHDTGPGWKGNANDGYIAWTGDTQTGNVVTVTGAHYATQDQCVAESQGNVC